MKLTQTTGPTLGGQKSKGRKNSNLIPWKRRPQTQYIKKMIMKRQINITKMKGQTRKIEVQINKEEIGKLPEKEFRIMIAKMIKNLENKMERIQESKSTNKDLEELKNKHTKTNNTITEIKNTLEEINSRISEVEE